VASLADTALRDEFPVLAGTDLAYLDSAATAQTPRAVLEAMDEYYTQFRASVHRGVYPLAARATEAFEGARQAIAAFAGAEPRGTILTRNATEALNLVAFSWGSAHLRSGDVVVVTELEHHSSLVPWQMACERAGARIAAVPVDVATGELELDVLDEVLAAGDVKAVVTTHVSNVTGTIVDVAELARRAHAAGAILVVDGAQAVPQLPVDVGALGADFYAWTGHKAYGPTGIGVLHGRYDTLRELPPMLGGGHMISAVQIERSTYAEPPARFEAGTSNIAEAIGLGAACGWLAGIGMEAVREHERAVTAYAIERLGAMEGVTLHGPRDPDRRGALLSFAVDGVHPHDVAEILGSRGVCVRAGHHCAQPLMRRLGVAATTRASFAVHSSAEEVDRLADGILRVQEIFA
jgi:cysteine desulfurase / selenocysteine lyase